LNAHVAGVVAFALVQRVLRAGLGRGEKQGTA
jgi:hypothetical protein